MVMIEKASISHLKQILDVINKSNKEAYKKIIPKEHFKDPVLSLDRLLEDFDKMDFYVYLYGGKVVGVAALHVLEEDVGRIRWVYVLPEFQRRGIGTALVTYVENQAEKLGLKKLWLLVVGKAYWATNFYEKLGYRITKRIERPWGYDLIMEKRIG